MPYGKNGRARGDRAEPLELRRIELHVAKQRRQYRRCKRFGDVGAVFGGSIIGERGSLGAAAAGARLNNDGWVAWDVLTQMFCRQPAVQAKRRTKA